MQVTASESQQEVYNSCELKIEKISLDDLRRNDLVFFQKDIWKCESVNMRIFQNLETKQQIKIPSSQNESNKFTFMRIEKLELIPKEWKCIESKTQKAQSSVTKIMLVGQELGMGPTHEVEVMGMRTFEELEVVKSEKIKGRNISFKVILCKTKKTNCFLIGGVDFLN